VYTVLVGLLKDHQTRGPQWDYSYVISCICLFHSNDTLQCKSVRLRFLKCISNAHQGYIYLKNTGKTGIMWHWHTITSNILNPNLFLAISRMWVTWSFRNIFFWMLFLKRSSHWLPSGEQINYNNQNIISHPLSGTNCSGKASRTVLSRTRSGKAPYYPSLMPQGRPNV